MAVLSSLGVGSGLDLSGMVTKLVAAEKAPVENALNRRQARLVSDLSGVGLMKAALASFQTKLAGLGNANSYSTRVVSNTNTEALTVSSTNKAKAGGYSIDVNAVAKNHALVSPKNSFSNITDTVGTGTIQIRFGTITGPGFSAFAANTDKTVKTITVDSSNNTLVGLKDHINQGDFGVAAAIINDGSGYRLTLTSNDTGIKNALEINITDTGDTNNTDANGLSVLAYNASATNLLESQAAVDASVNVNGLAISSATNTLTQVIEGVTLILNKQTTTSVSMNISESTAQLSQSVKDIVEAYNQTIKTLEELSSAGSPTTTAGVLFGDSSLRNATNGLRRLITSPVEGLKGSVGALSNIGILTKADGSLSIDDAKFSAAIKANPTGVLALFTPVGQTTDSLVTFKSSTSLSTPGNYPINITTIATQGVLQGAAVNSFTVDSDNDNLSLQIDGVSTGNISLTQGVYASAEALASEIQSKINSVSRLSSGSKSVTVTYDSSNNQFLLKSQLYGSQSKVEITSVDSNTLTDFGLKVEVGTAGVDVAGSIGGKNASGSGQLLSVDGLTVEVLGSNLGERGHLNFSRGFVEGINNLLNTYLNPTSGSIVNRENGLNSALTEIANERVELTDYLLKVETRLISRFTTLDTLLSKLQSTGNFLTQQIKTLPGSGQLLNKK